VIQPRNFFDINESVSGYMGKLSKMS